MDPTDYAPACLSPTDPVSEKLWSSEYRTVGKAQKLSNHGFYAPSSGPLRMARNEYVFFSV
jgi:hypothetical protein